MNWDEADHREMILKNRFPSRGLVVLDEIHKYKMWRNWIKGKFDVLKDTHQILVTGSARLDLYRYSGDSLQGRYFFYRMHPLSVAELGLSSKKEKLIPFTMDSSACASFKLPILMKNLASLPQSRIL